MDMIPRITECTFKVGPKRKGKRNIWCTFERRNVLDGPAVITGFSGTSIDLAYRDFRRQWMAFVK